MTQTLIGVLIIITCSCSIEGSSVDSEKDNTMGSDNSEEDRFMKYRGYVLSQEEVQEKDRLRPLRKFVYTCYDYGLLDVEDLEFTKTRLATFTDLEALQQKCLDHMHTRANMIENDLLWTEVLEFLGQPHSVDHKVETTKKDPTPTQMQEFLKQQQKTHLLERLHWCYINDFVASEDRKLIDSNETISTSDLQNMVGRCESESWDRGWKIVGFSLLATALSLVLIFVMIHMKIIH
jgi:hypothetical protein